MPVDVSDFQCLRCRGALQSSLDSCGCVSCGALYPAFEGIPSFIRDAAAFKEQLDEARRIKPDWYVSEQPPEIASPWRHHLRKRRLYVQSRLRRHLARRGGRAERLLDIGCGDGNNLTWLTGYAENTYGSDYNLLRLARARARGTGAVLFHADILDYPSPDGFFDVVYFNHVLEHIPDDESALRTIHRILRPGGLLVLGVPNEGCWWWQLAYSRQPGSLAATDHVHFYTEDSIRPKVEACGLEVSEVRHMGWGPPDFVWDMRLRRFWLLDHLFDALGRVALPRQASSLYVLAVKPDKAG